MGEVRFLVGVMAVSGGGREETHSCEVQICGGGVGLDGLLGPRRGTPGFFSCWF